MAWIDVHTHLNMLNKKSPQVVIQTAKDSGVDRVITIGTSPEDLPIVFQLAKNFSPFVSCALGIHPHEARLFNEESQKFIESHLNSNFVVAIGEIGLDYYYKHSDPEIQKEVFRKQIEIALKSDLPIQIHTRDAEKDTLDILKSFNPTPQGLIHCFTGSKDLLEEALNLGLNISFSGIITFKNASNLRNLVKITPLNRLHLETDAPFLTPHPFRGQNNEPSYIYLTAKKMAEIKEISISELSSITTKNTIKLFKKLKPLNSAH